VEVAGPDKWQMMKKIEMKRQNFLLRKQELDQLRGKWAKRSITQRRNADVVTRKREKMAWNESWKWEKRKRMESRARRGKKEMGMGRRNEYEEKRVHKSGWQKKTVYRNVLKEQEKL
jgi:hypothetical protein